MSKLANQLREIRVYNNHGLLMQFGGENDVAIEYYARPSGRIGWTMVNHSEVWSPRSNPKLAREGLSSTWKKSFQGNRAESYYAARNWAMETFGHDYVPSPFGGMIPKHVRHKAEQAARASQLPSNQSNCK